MDRTDIANMALRRVGEQTIGSFDETSKNAEIIKLIFDPVYEQCLLSHRWNFATKRASIPESTETPTFGYTKMYPLPTDPKCIKVVRLESYNDNYRVEGDNIVCDEASPLNIVYIAKINDFSKLTPLFTKFFYLSLAVEMAYTMVESNAILNGLVQLQDKALEEARQIDTQEGTEEIEQSSSWLKARYQGIGANSDITTVI